MNPRHLRVLAAGLGLLLGGAALAGGPEPWEARLQGSDGEPRLLSAYRGKPTVLFYEERGSTELNQPLKDTLFEQGRTKGLLGAAYVVAVANLTPYDFFPARDFALKKVRSLEKRFGIPILVDWDGTLSSPPWLLPSKTASVLILDEEGRVVLRKSGRLSAEEQDEVLRTLGSLLGSSNAGARR